jgi:hypothetical protein
MNDRVIETDDAEVPDASEPSETFVLEPTGELIEINDFNLAVDVLDLEAFIRSDVAEALLNAEGTDSAVLTFFDGTQMVIRGANVSAETIRQAEIVVAGSNQIAQGTVSISGLPDSGPPEVGQSLEASVEELYDGDGIVEGSLSFQWYLNDTPIEGATESTYVLSEADLDGTLSVRATYEDLFGKIETLPSDAVSLDPNSDPDGGDTPGETPGGDDDDPATPDTPDDPSVGDGVNDTPVSATRFQDIFTARADMDSIDGREGVDTIVFPGDQSNYVVTFTARGADVSDKRLDGLGTMSLENIEIIGFETSQGQSSPRMDLRQVDGYADLSNEQFEALIELYIAYYNRAPDATGLAFWSNAYADGMSIEEIAGMFNEQDETRAVYREDVSNLHFVAEVYENVLGRAPDLEGLTFWKNTLNSGEVGRDAFIMELLQGVEATAPDGTPQAFIDRQRADQQYLDLKTDLGALFAVHHGMSDIDAASQVMALFDGSTEGFEEASDAIAAFYAEAMDPENGDFLMPLVGVMDTTSLI